MKLKSVLSLFIYTILINTILIFLTINVNAQTGEWKQYFPEYNHLPYYPDVNVIKVDRFNNKWFGLNGYTSIYGSGGGLTKFDGENWTQYKTTNSSLPDNNITAITFDLEDNTWIGMRDSGIAMLKNDSITLIKGPLQFIQSGRVKDILADKLGNIWVLYSSVRYPGIIDKPYALMKFDGENWSNMNLDSIVTPGQNVYCIAFDNNNNLYCGSYNKILKYDGNNWTQIAKPGANKVLHISIDNANILWIAVDGSDSVPTLILYDNGTWKNTLELYSDGTPSEIIFDKEGNVWTSGANSAMGLGKYSNNKWQYFHRKNSAILWDWMNTLALDSTGIIWCGTGFGVCTYDGINWTYYSSSGGPPFESITKVLVDDDNNKWVATSNLGMAKFNGNIWQVYDKSNSDIPYNDVNDIALDSEGKVWAATGYGLGVFDGNSWQVYNEENTGYPINNIFEIEIDSKGKVWLTLFDLNALLSFDGINWNIFDADNSILPEDFIGRLGIDKNDNIWVGTQDGLFVYDGSSWANFNIDNSGLPSNYVECFGFDSTGNSWVGTANGLIRIKGDEWEILDNISGMDISEVAVDGNNNVWVGYYWGQGFSKYDGNTWKNFNFVFDPALGGIGPLTIDFDEFDNLWIATLFQGLVEFNETKIVSVERTNAIAGRTDEPQIAIYPNPFNPSTKIEFYIYERGFVSLKVYDLLGNEIRTLVNSELERGNYQIDWKGDNQNQEIISAGIYFCKLSVRGRSEIKKMLLIK